MSSASTRPSSGGQGREHLTAARQGGLGINGGGGGLLELSEGEIEDLEDAKEMAEIAVAMGEKW